MITVALLYQPLKKYCCTYCHCAGYGNREAAHGAFYFSKFHGFCSSHDMRRCAYCYAFGDGVFDSQYAAQQAACDISEQISLASKEASGTSNMKFMLNGAVTLGTMDGANVEIAELVGPENIYTFGQSSDEVIGLYKKGTYNAYTYYQADANLKRSVDFLISEEMRTEGDEISLNRLYDELVHKDWFMTFPDFREYCTVKNKVLKDYEDRASWAGKMLVNISKAGFFSSDRTIRQYNDEIWHLEESEQK